MNGLRLDHECQILTVHESLVLTARAANRFASALQMGYAVAVMTPAMYLFASRWDVFLCLVWLRSSHASP